MRKTLRQLKYRLFKILVSRRWGLYRAYVIEERRKEISEFLFDLQLVDIQYKEIQKKWVDRLATLENKF